MATPESIDTLLRDKLYERFYQLHDAFRALDQDCDGFISVDDFAAAITGLGFARVTRAMVAALVAKYDTNGDGLISYAEFCSKMSGGTPIPGGPEPAHQVVCRAERVEETLRAHVLAASISLQNAFLKLDKDRSGRISIAELERVLADASVPVSDEEMAAIVHRYDRDADGRLDLGELASLLEAGAQSSCHVAQRTVRAPPPPAKRARSK